MPTGRWGEAPHEPDRCYSCFEVVTVEDPRTGELLPNVIRHFEATGYVETVEDNGYGGTHLFRRGICNRGDCACASHPGTCGTRRIAGTIVEY
jgi:hypothetical protein